MRSTRKLHFLPTLLLWVVLPLLSQAIQAEDAFGQARLRTRPIHSAPIIVAGHQVARMTQYPISMYRLFRTDSRGTVYQIPFQIDEVNSNGDYVLNEGGTVTAGTGNGVFDLRDELAFMGDDVGAVKEPASFGDYPTPNALYEIRMDYPALKRPRQQGDGRYAPETARPNAGAVYVGVYFNKPPPLLEKTYVVFNRERAEMLTSRYRYRFDPRNWLVAKSVDMVTRSSNSSLNGQKESVADKKRFINLLDSTTFFMRADLKYFLTLEANHRSIESQLEAYKRGPIRTIVRITFHYEFLKLNFELGMYTEVSFFSNAVHLPAILYNPIEGSESLNRGSGFYYGLALAENPAVFDIKTNMPSYKAKGFFDFLKAREAAEDLYWISATGRDRMLYLEIAPSTQMREAGAIPRFYQEDLAGPKLTQRSNDTAKPLGAAPVNLALHFDMQRFAKGEHDMAFRLFFENRFDEQTLATFKNLSKWRYRARRITND